MRVTGNDVEGTPLFSSYKSPASSSYFSSSSPHYDDSNSLASGNKDGITRSYINKFESLPFTDKTSSDRPPRSTSPVKYDSLSSTSSSPFKNNTYSFSTYPSKLDSMSCTSNSLPSTTSPKLASKFPRYFGASGRSNSPSLSGRNSPFKDYGYSSSSLPSSSGGVASGDGSPLRSSSSSRFCSPLPADKPYEDSGSSLKTSSGTWSRFGPSSLQSSRTEENSVSPSLSSRFGSSLSNNSDQPVSSSFLKLARLNLTPVKFRAKKLSALG